MFAAALNDEAVGAALQHYHPRSAVHILHLDRPRGPAERLVGLGVIGTWLAGNVRNSSNHLVTNMVGTCDRLTFYEQRTRRDGVQVLEENMAEITGGLITNQYVIIGWHDLGNNAISPA